MVKPLGLRRQVLVLAAEGVDLLQSLEPGAQLGYFDSPGLGRGLPLLELLGGLPACLVRLGVTAAQGGVVRASQGVQGGALGRGRAQPQLVGLPVDGDQPAAHLAEHRGRNGSPSQIGAGTAGGRDRARGQEKVVIEVGPGLNSPRGGARVGVDEEGPLNQAAFGACAHDGGLGTLAQQQPE